MSAPSKNKNKRFSIEGTFKFDKKLESKSKSKRKTHNQETNSKLKNLIFFYKPPKNSNKDCTVPELVGHSMIHLQDDPTVILFGGLETNDERTNNILSFDLESKTLKSYDWDKQKGGISNLLGFSSKKNSNSDEPSKIKITKILKFF